MTDPAGLFRLLSDGRTTLAQVRAGIEEYGAAERAAGRKEERERIRAAAYEVGLDAASAILFAILDAPAEE